jgi:hypothetical protein
MLKATVRPVAVRRYDEANVCDTIRVVGYRAECACGWRSTTQTTMREARARLRAHRRTHP